MGVSAPERVSLTVLCAGLLQLDDALHLVVQHLKSRDCESLRNTCKALRRHTAVLDGITGVAMASHHLEALQQLRNLHRLRVCAPDTASIFHLHHLTILTSLVIAGMPNIDLYSLSFIPSLRLLQLRTVGQYGSLHSLQQLLELDLVDMTATPAVLQLSGLTKLSLSEGSQAASLGQLGQLVALSILPWHGTDDWTADASAGLAAVTEAGLQALRELRCHLACLPPLYSLAGLTALDIGLGQAHLPVALQDLRQLTGLVKLGLTGYLGQPDLQSDSVTALHLTIPDYDECDDLGFPCLAGCSRLQHVMLFRQTDVTISFEQLPPGPMTIWIEYLSGLFLEARIRESVRLQKVGQLSWKSDPATLKAE